MASDDNSLLLITYLSLTCLFSAVQKLEHMTEENITRVMEFILLGFFSPERDWNPSLLLILVVYSLTLVGNIYLISLIQLDPHLHTPMYFSVIWPCRLLLLLLNSPKVPETLRSSTGPYLSMRKATQLGFFPGTSWFWRCSFLQ